MDLKRQLGFSPDSPVSCFPEQKLIQYINLKLAALGCPLFEGAGDADLQRITLPLLQNHREKDRLLADYLCPADQRIQTFLDEYLGDGDLPRPRLPSNTFVLDRHGPVSYTHLTLPTNREV